jgi:hypothetical protein
MSSTGDFGWSLGGPDPPHSKVILSHATNHTHEKTTIPSDTSATIQCIITNISSIDNKQWVISLSIPTILVF